MCDLLDNDFCLLLCIIDLLSGHFDDDRYVR
jgi:hypothetical protein